EEDVDAEEAEEAEAARAIHGRILSDPLGEAPEGPDNYRRIVAWICWAGDSQREWRDGAAVTLPTVKSTCPCHPCGGWKIQTGGRRRAYDKMDSDVTGPFLYFRTDNCGRW